MKIAILGVGTELTTGQILNRNAQWISQKLYQLGVETGFHLVVADEAQDIRDSLLFLQDQTEIILVTGGLGPTSDDFTRDLIAEWCGEKLEFHPASWSHLESQLSKRGLQAKDIHRQECFFPKGAEVFQNNVGTANAFYLGHKGKHLFALPGPPKEIEGLWNDHLENKIKLLCKGVDPKRTWSWDCIGLAEAELAALVEPVLAKCSLEKAYRVHLPYVEFKLSYLESQKSAQQVWENSVTEVLKPWIISRNGEDLARKVSKTLVASHSEFWICDEVTGSALISRLLPELRGALKENLLSFISNEKYISQEQRQNPGFQIVCGPNPQEVKFIFHKKSETSERICRAPDRYSNWSERRLQYFAEYAIIFCEEQLRRNP